MRCHGLVLARDPQAGNSPSWPCIVPMWDLWWASTLSCLEGWFWPSSHGQTTLAISLQEGIYGT